MSDLERRLAEVDAAAGDLARRLELLEGLVRDLVLREPTTGGAPPSPRLAAPRPAAEGRWLVVRVAGRRLGLPLEAVREVVRSVALEPVPGSARALVGLLDLRGQPVEVIDLRAAIGAPALDDDLDARIVVARATLEGEERALGFKVDEAVGLTRVEAGVVEAAPELSAARYLIGVVRAEAEGEGALLLLDPARLIEALGEEGAVSAVGADDGEDVDERAPADETDGDAQEGGA